jgi:hypothetical protein
MPVFLISEREGTKWPVLLPSYWNHAVRRHSDGVGASRARPPRILSSSLYRKKLAAFLSPPM